MISQVRVANPDNSVYFIDKGSVELYVDLNSNGGGRRKTQLKKKSNFPIGKSKTGKESSRFSLAMDSGLEEIYEPNPEEKVLVFRKHTKHSYFGEEDIIKMKQRSYNAVCTEDCDMYTLDKIVLFDLL